MRSCKTVEHSRPNRAFLLTAFQRAAGEIALRDFMHVSETTRLDRLAIDSLGMVEVVGHLEQQLNMATIPDERLAGLTTVGQLLDVVEAQLG